MIGLESGRVELSYSYRMSVREFRLAARQMRAHLGTGCLIEHVGSTAVPQMLAKPIVDIALGVYGGGHIPEVLRALSGLQYRYRGFREDAGGHIADYVHGIYTRRHVHIVEATSAQWNRYIALRDYLREVPAARRSYERFKSELASLHRGDRRRYTAAKREFVEMLTDDACSWQDRAATSSG